MVKKSLTKIKSPTFGGAFFVWGTVKFCGEDKKDSIAHGVLLPTFI